MSAARTLLGRVDGGSEPGHAPLEAVRAVPWSGEYSAQRRQAVRFHLECFLFLLFLLFLINLLDSARAPAAPQPLVATDSRRPRRRTRSPPPRTTASATPPQEKNSPVMIFESERFFLFECSGLLSFLGAPMRRCAARKKGRRCVLRVSITKVQRAERRPPKHSRDVYL